MCNSYDNDEFLYRAIYKAACICMIQADFRLNSGYFGMDYAVHGN